MDSKKRYPVLHPFTWMPGSSAQEPAFQETVVRLETGKGSWVYDEHGKPFLYTTTAVPSVGLGHPYVLEQMSSQLQKLSFASTCAQTHALVEQTADRLLQKCGSPFASVFFGTDGSGAIETAMKLTLQYFMTRGETRRTKFISLEGNYHGTTIASGSITHTGIQEAFGPGMPGCLAAPMPNRFRPPVQTSTEEGMVRYCLHVLEEIIFEEDPQTIAAIVLEPVQGVSGIYELPRSYVNEVRAIADRYGIILIMDEVATGCGRTGYWTQSQHYGVKPDLLALSKGMTGGYFPMGATLISETIIDMLCGNGGIFLHGSTQSGHPVGCAAALAVMDVIDNERLLEQARTMGAQLLEQLRSRLAGHPQVGDIRGVGMMLAIEFVRDKSTMEAVDHAFGMELSKALHHEGILGNFFNGILIMYPPLNLSHDEADFLVNGVANALQHVQLPPSTGREDG